MKKYTPKKGKYGFNLNVTAIIRENISFDEDQLDKNGQVTHSQVIKAVQEYFESLDGSPDAGSCLMGVAKKDINVV